MTWTTIVRRTLPMADSGNIQLGAVGGVAGGQPTLMEVLSSGIAACRFQLVDGRCGSSNAACETIKRLAPG
jgi:hypothetical protein